MFGTYRFLLASAVIVFHLLPKVAANAGYQAVFCFFVLSGYLMTRVLNEVYGFSFRGMRNFVANRALRIYPPYWVAASLSLVVIIVAGDLPATMNNGLRLPGSFSEWALNFIILGHCPPGAVPRLIPPVWTLHVEWVYYLLLCLVLARKKSIALLWLGFSGCLTAALFAYAAHADRSFLAVLYYSTLASSLPFAAGSALYFISRDLRRVSARISRRLYLWTVGMVAGFYALTSVLDLGLHPRHGTAIFLYAALLIGIAATFVLQGGVDMPKKEARVDRFMGDLSYPMYLLHWPVAVGLAWIGFDSRMLSRIGFFTAAYATTITASTMLHLFLERPIDRFRASLRSKPSPPSNGLGMLPALAAIEAGRK